MTSTDAGEGLRPIDPYNEPGAAPQAAPAAAQNAPRPTLGPGYDWLLELGRQSYRTLLGLVCILSIADSTVFSSWFRGGEGRLDEVTLLTIVGLAGALAGIRAAELSNVRLMGR